MQRIIASQALRFCRYVEVWSHHEDTTAQKTRPQPKSLACIQREPVAIKNRHFDRIPAEHTQVRILFEEVVNLGFSVSSCHKHCDFAGTVDQVSLVYVLASCHSASLAEEVTSDMGTSAPAN